jgi:hypothetical protein
MQTTTLAVVEPQEAVSLLESPLSPAESAQLQSCELAIELAGKDRLEKALIIGEKLSTIYNEALFRGADGGCAWEQWVEDRLTKLLPDEATGKTAWADYRRWLWESRSLLSPSPGRGAQPPVSLKQAEALTALIPRKFSASTGWNPAILDDPDAAQGIAKVWELACQNAETNQRRNGPTAEDVRAAREELRPALERQGLIRSAPASFQAATAARVEAARQRTVDVTPTKGGRAERYEDVAHEAQVRRDFCDTMASIRDTKAERTAKVEVNHVREQLDAAEQEQRHELEEQVRHYNRRLHDAGTAIHDLLGYLQTLSRTHGTQLLDEMRGIDVLGLITVKDDMHRLQEMGTELMDAVKLARTSDPSTGINAQTIEV